MPEYSNQFKDHLAHPRNAGELAEANAVADEQNPVCGDRLRLSLMVASDRIETARYLAYGCPPTLVCGSVLTELITGKTIAEAKNLTRADLLDAIGGLPELSQFLYLADNKLTSLTLPKGLVNLRSLALGSNQRDAVIMRVAQSALRALDNRTLLQLLIGRVGRVACAIVQPRVGEVAHIDDIDADVAGIRQRIHRGLKEEVARILPGA